MSQVGCASASSRVTPSQVGAAAERAAAGRQHELVDGPRPLALEQLEQRRVLGVDRDQLRAGGLGQRGHQLAAHHEALLVGQREVDALAERGHGRPQPRRADQRVEHEVAVGVGDQLDEPLGAREHRRRARRRARRRRGRRARCAPRRSGAACSSSSSQLDRGGQPDHLELGAALDHVERLGADRARGPDDDDSAHPAQSRSRRPAPRAAPPRRADRAGCRPRGAAPALASSAGSAGAVGPLGRHRVVGVAGEQDARAQRDLARRPGRPGSRRRPSARAPRARAAATSDRNSTARGCPRRSAGARSIAGRSSSVSGPGLLRIASGTPSSPMSCSVAA